MKPLLDTALGQDLAGGIATILRASLDHALEHPNIKPNTRGIHELCEALRNIASVTKAPEIVQVPLADRPQLQRWKWWQVGRKR